MAGGAKVTQSVVDDDVIALTSGHFMQNAFIEEIARELIPALDQIVVLQAVNGNGKLLIALCTLQLSEDLGGRLLGDDAITLAKPHNSTANTLITSRSCVNFRHGLESSFSKVNLALAASGHPDCLIHRCHILLSKFCKEDNTLKPSGELHRAGVRRKYGNLLNTLSTPVSSGDSMPAGTVMIPPSAADKSATRKGLKKYSVMSHESWLRRQPGDQQPLVTKLKSTLQRGWELARGVKNETTRKDQLPDVGPDIEEKILKYKGERENSDSCNTSVCNSDVDESTLDE